MKKGLTSGFTLYLAIIIMGALMLIAINLVNLAVKQYQISSAARESQYAFYAADTGMECAVYWDIKNPGSATGMSAFSTVGTSNITCNNGTPQTVGGSATSTFDIDFSAQSLPYCASVTVVKSGTDPIVTTIESKGYNTCDTSNPKRVERAVRATY